MDAALTATAAAPAPRRGRRSIEERVALALPGALVRGTLRAYARLPPGSELRRRFCKRAFARGLEGSARGDHAFALMFYEPDIELRVVGEVVRALGVAGSYTGRDGYVEAWNDYTRDMGELRVVPEQFIDLGDRIALRASLVGVGRSSGAETSRALGYVCYFSKRGLIERLEGYWTWDEALASLRKQA